MDHPQDSFAVTRKEMREFYPKLAPHIRRTPVISVDGAEFGWDPGTVALKLELLQHTGSFKARGAVTNLLTKSVPRAGVVAASGGNHGVAIAFAARKFGVPARIYVPTVASIAKIDRIRGYGAELVIGGERYAEAGGRTNVSARAEVCGARVACERRRDQAGATGALERDANCGGTRRGGRVCGSACKEISAGGCGKSWRGDLRRKYGCR